MSQSQFFNYMKQGVKKQKTKPNLNGLKPSFSFNEVHFQF